MEKPKVYYAVPIRGKMGKDATAEYMATNCARAKQNIEVLKKMHPEIEWFSVAPYDRIVQRLLLKGAVKIEDVLEADFEIGDESDGLLAHVWEPSGGADQEFERQSDKEKPCLYLNTPDVWQIWHADTHVIESFAFALITRKFILEDHQRFKDVVQDIVTLEEF